MPKRILSGASAASSISENLYACTEDLSLSVWGPERFSISTKDPQASHMGHLPSQLLDSFPQAVQLYANLPLAIINPNHSADCYEYNNIPARK
jgi:hypothetical protein